MNLLNLPDLKQLDFDTMSAEQYSAIIQHVERRGKARL
jgi:hypothetical protein